ncbi:MAG: hypothetical protein IT215_07375 [Chitinophagaceae bacterium]|nr:hypothetical protein [Chitinophagaceae bacterium]
MNKINACQLVANTFATRTRQFTDQSLQKRAYQSLPKRISKFSSYLFQKLKYSTHKPLQYRQNAYMDTAIGRLI